MLRRRAVTAEPGDLLSQPGPGGGREDGLDVAIGLVEGEPELHLDERSGEKVRTNVRTWARPRTTVEREAANAAK